MNLFEQMYETFILMEKKRTPDGEGGYVTAYTEGTSIEGVMVLNSSAEAQLAESQGVNAVYRFTTGRDVELDYQNILKNAQNGRYYRITSRREEIVSPSVSTIDIAQYNAEKWSIE